MDNGEEHAPGNTVQDKILRLIAELCPGAAGEVLLPQLHQLLEVERRQRLTVERLYSAFIALLLDALALSLEEDDPLFLQARAIRTRLTPPLSEAELLALRLQVEEMADQVTTSEYFTRERVEEVIEPLQRLFTETGLSPSAPLLSPDSMAEAIQLATARLAVALEEAVAQGEEFTTFLEVEYQALEGVKQEGDLEARRRRLQEELAKILRGQQRLNRHFDQIQRYLAQLEADRENFAAELSRMIELSLTDELTGLPNRRAFLQRLQDEAARAHRYGTPLALAIIDIDHFKLINDQYGHAAGDAVLHEYARHVLSVFRHHDMVARYGGEEFAVLFPGTFLEGVIQALEKAQRRVRGHRVKIGEEGAVVLPPFSAGVALLQPGESGQDLIQRADQALYRAKREGRDRICTAEDQTETPE